VLRDHLLKWTDLKALAASYLGKDDELIRVVFFTAVNSWDQAKRQRHVNYIKALEATGVEVIRSRFDRVQKHCFQQDRFCPIREEKQTDVAIAVEVLSDCYERGIERILLITADSDQVPLVRKVRDRFPKTNVLMIAPPKRLAVARELGGVSSGVAELSAGRIRQHPLPAEIRDGRGRLIASRPAMYAPND
ncbi:MAG: NYN domain-containing protein, partial [Rhizobiaceae bacterium]